MCGRVEDNSLHDDCREINLANLRQNHFPCDVGNKNVSRWRPANSISVCTFLHRFKLDRRTPLVVVVVVGGLIPINFQR